MPPSVLAVLGDGVVPPDTPLLRTDDLGVVRGEGVFETLRVVAGRPVLLAAHLQRMRRSAARVDLSLPQEEQWRSLVDEALAAWGDEAEAALRLTCTKGVGDGSPGLAWALLSPVSSALAEQRRDGLSAVTLGLGVAAGFRPDAPWLLGGVKSTSYAMNMAALREAANRGADDAVLVSSDDEVLEAPTASVLWWDGRTLVTPPPDEVSVLPGTTVDAALRLAVADGMPVAVRRGTVAELRQAREAGLLSSVRGVAPLVTLDGAPVGDGRPGPAMSAVRDAYEDLSAGRRELPPDNRYG